MNNKKLKIAYFLDNFFPQINGVVTSSINTAFEMSNRGHSIYGVVPVIDLLQDYRNDYFPFPTYFQKGFPASFYPDFYFTYPFSIEIIKIMKDFSPDIIHFHAPITMGYQAIRIARMLNIPIVGTFHTFFAEPEYLKVIGLENSKLLQKSLWWYSNQFFERCDAVVSPGKETANILKTQKLKNELYVISNGVDVKKYRDFNFTWNLPVEIKNDEKWIIYIGRISEEKCLSVLFDSMKIIGNKDKKIKLLIVGHGPTEKIMQNKAVKMGLSDNIVFTGQLTNKDLLESGLLKKMKLFVTPSTSENQPMTILESIMFGLPIIGAHAKGIPELIEGNGFTVNPGDPADLADKILLTLNDKDLYEKFSKKSVELSEKYDISNTSNKMEELYLRLVEKRKTYHSSKLDHINPGEALNDKETVNLK